MQELDYTEVVDLRIIENTANMKKANHLSSQRDVRKISFQ